jgi:hypothetical protein
VCCWDFFCSALAKLGLNEAFPEYVDLSKAEVKAKVTVTYSNLWLLES